MFTKSKFLFKTASNFSNKFNNKFNNNLFLHTSFFNFQNKIILSKENFNIVNTPAYNKVSLKSTPDSPIKEKTFYFGIKIL